MHADLGSGVPHGYFLAEYYAPIPGVAAGQSKIFLQVLTKEKNARKKRLPLGSRIQCSFCLIR
jgi:hypothetical protein